MGPEGLQRPPDRIFLEVCTDDLQGSVDAEAAGADRIELNQCMEMGGLTPSIGLLRNVIREVSLPVITMVRPRPGGFVYSSTQSRVMLTDAAEALSAGASGVAFGALTPDGAPDEKMLHEMRKVTEGCELVFHRAFDLAGDMEAALVLLASAGVDRVLTSGGRTTAEEGIRRIAGLVRLSGGKPRLMPGGGVNPGNVRMLVLTSGCRDIHGSFSSRTVPVHNRESMFAGGDRMTDAGVVRQVRTVLDDL